MPGDFDGNCTVDSEDRDVFVSCVSGPDFEMAPECAASDFDGDNDVDQEDFGIWQRCYSGAGALADPNCMD